jgi:radical SAM superfamily enzyme YgiQ (UPF0313 family)
MRVLLVWPNKEQSGSKPNSLSLLAALLRRDGHEVALLDTTFAELGPGVDNTVVGTRARIFKPVETGAHDLSKRPAQLDELVHDALDGFRPDLLAVSALSDELPLGLRISVLAKRLRPALPVLWGNKAATLTPERLLRSPAVDLVCRGEGIELLPELVRALEAGASPATLPNLGWRDGDRIRLNPLRPYFQDLDSLPSFDYSIYDPRQLLKPFDGHLLRGGDHMIAWGCPNHCSYCINDTLRELHGPAAGRFVRRYGVARIVAELAALASRHQLELYKFHDEDFCLKPLPYLREIARAYRASVGLPFTAMANAHTVSEEKADLLAEMGCRSISLGFETGNEQLRRTILRRRESLEDLVQATERLRRRGIRTSSFNMLGLPFETRGTVLETIELNRAAGVDSPNVNFFFPFPGTDLHRIAVEHGFYAPDADAVYRSDRPALTLPALPSEELIALRERFVLYVKLPRELWPLIERSEHPDAVGEALTDALYRLYDETVLTSPDSRWPAGRDPSPEVMRLGHLAGGGAPCSPTDEACQCAPC